MLDNKTEKVTTILDLGSGQGITSIFLVKEYGFKVYATDLHFDKNFFDAIVSTDSYNYKLKL